MENLGYKEGSMKVKYRPTRSNVNNFDQKKNARYEEIPLNETTIPNSTSVAGCSRGQSNFMPNPIKVLNSFEYMNFGSSPPAEIVPTNYELKTIDEPITGELTVQLCNDTIRMNLIEQMDKESGRIFLLNDIEQININVYNIRKVYENASDIEKNISLLWAAFTKHWELLNDLIEVGADILYYDDFGLSALHLAAFSDCQNSIKILLIKNDINPNYQPKYYTPLHCAAFGNSVEIGKLLIECGADVNIYTKQLPLEETILHCAVRVNAIKFIQFLIGEGADVNSIKPNGTNAIHLATDLGLTKCLKVLLSSPNADPDIRINDKESTALHLAADEGYLKCINLLLFKGVDVNLKNHRGYTALHLAARTSSIECVETLLLNGNADPNVEDYDKRTPLHTIIGKSENTYDLVKLLIKYGSDINHRDIFGITALHLAAMEGLIDCVELLIQCGADVTIKSKQGISALNVINRKTPSAMKLLMRILDSSITMHESKCDSREIEVELDFQCLLKHCFPMEIDYLNKIIDEGHTEILEHPLSKAFLYLKWTKIRKYYIGRLCFCFINVLLLSLYVLTALAHTCYNKSIVDADNDTIVDHEICQRQSVIGDVLRNNPFFIEMQWGVLVAIMLFEIFRKLYGFFGYRSLRHYFGQIENLFEWYVIISVFLISYNYNQRVDIWQNHVAAFAILMGWTNLMLMIGQLPFFGVYIAMYTKVQGEFAKLFMAYLCMLIGFTISFCVVFPSLRIFENPLMGFISVLVMMVGEHDLGMLDGDLNAIDSPVLLEISAQIIFILFHLFITIILMNLLVGIAVDDISALKKTAQLSKLLSQIKLISYIELTFFIKYLPIFIRNFLHRTSLISPQTYRVLFRVKPLNPEERRLPKHLLVAVYEMAKRNKDEHIIHSKLSSDMTDSNDNNNNNNNFINNNIYYNKNEINNYIYTKVNVTTQKIAELSQQIDELKLLLSLSNDVIDKLQKINVKTLH